MEAETPDTGNLDAAAVAALERFRRWVNEHPDRATSIALLTTEQQADMDWWIDEHCPDGLLLWDDGGDYAGVYRRGLLRGMVFFLLHDDQDLTPRFASIGAFVDAVVEDDDDAGDLTTLRDSDRYDLPPVHLDPSALTERSALARQVFAAGSWADDDADEDAQIQSYRSALALLPDSAVPQDLLDDIAGALLSSTNLYLWQEAPRLLVRHNYHGLRKQIAEVVRAHRENPRWLDQVAPLRAVLGPVREVRGEI